MTETGMTEGGNDGSAGMREGRNDGRRECRKNEKSPSGA